MSRVLVTGSAGFIGQATALALLRQGHEVIGADNLTPYYDVRLKQERLSQLTAQPSYRHHAIDLADSSSVATLFAQAEPEYVIHLAAQAGVRYSLQAPHAYVASNITALVNMLEGCRQHGVKHFLFASSSSVYGANTHMPFATHHHSAHPVSFYGATKKAGEVMTHSYSHLFGIPSTVLRFFTVYGPWGRPDMAYFKFANAILNGETIDIYNHGDMRRDFTYIDDIVSGVTRMLTHIPTVSNATADVPPDESRVAPYRMYNIGNHTPVKLLDMIALLEQTLGKTTNKRMLPIQPGDVLATYADVSALARDIGFAPSTPIQEGLKQFAEWFLAWRETGPTT